jgi:hypothetical protein
MCTDTHLACMSAGHGYLGNDGWPPGHDTKRDGQGPALPLQKALSIQAPVAPASVHVHKLWQSWHPTAPEPCTLPSQMTTQCGQQSSYKLPHAAACLSHWQGITLELQCSALPALLPWQTLETHRRVCWSVVREGFLHAKTGASTSRLCCCGPLSSQGLVHTLYKGTLSDSLSDAAAGIHIRTPHALSHHLLPPHSARTLCMDA